MIELCHSGPSKLESYGAEDRGCKKAYHDGPTEGTPRGSVFSGPSEGSLCSPQQSLPGRRHLCLSSPGERRPPLSRLSPCHPKPPKPTLPMMKTIGRTQLYVRDISQYHYRCAPAQTERGLPKCMVFPQANMRRFLLVIYSRLEENE